MRTLRFFDRQAATFHLNASYGGGTRAWLRDAARPELYPMRPLECVLPSGRALFVPSGWRHLIVNVQDSVGAAVEVGDVPMIQSFQNA